MTAAIPTRRRAARHRLCAVALAAAAAWLSPAGFAQPAGSSGPIPAPAAAQVKTLTLRQLGALAPLELRGADGSQSVPFNIRADEVVTSARLSLTFTHSPALLEQLSHLNVRVNDEVIATLPLPRAQAGTPQQRVVTIDPRLLGEYNRLTLQLIGHYTTECEDPMHSSLWANVGNTDSVLELGISPLPLANELRLLPAPFLDLRDASQLRLPFVLPVADSAAVLEAAGILASWFGAAADYRGAVFPTSVGSLPAQGHAVVLLLGNARLPGVEVPRIAGPTLSVQSHPGDPLGKLLLVMGRDEEELKTAATALALGRQALSGTTAVVGRLDGLAPRRPYDAPRWIASDRPVKLGELALDPRELQAAGQRDAYVKLPVRFPPALTSWRGAAASMELKYHHTPRTRLDDSMLNISLNEHHVRALPLAPGALEDFSTLRRAVLQKAGLGDTVAAEARLMLPVHQLPPSGQLSFHFAFDLHKEGACKDVMLENVRGAIHPDSTIDLSGLHHFIAMPDLAAFANQGFPFTRLADLAETAVVLPDAPSPADLSTYLALMGRFGGATGHPAVRVAVHTAAGSPTLEGKDLLLIGAPAQLPLLQQWEGRLPASLSPAGSRYTLSDAWARLLSWVRGDPQRPAARRTAELTLLNPGPQALVAGFESPLSRGRSVVAVMAERPQSLDALVDAMLSPALVGRFRGSLVSVREHQVETLDDEARYHVGSLGLVGDVHWFLSRHPLALFGLLALGSLLMALPAYLFLRRKARRRLAGAQ
ncbi:cellulose biosynthesis cyclic di-GMP-binding regulatory protein BcsB [Caldimonas tepidiphila]|uniref:cellulose biosynthesis cyclic di-GMP-binding regulatory protein BcsB n=1 Tax=Caldimonas tepidiphila TaxID=2315841 RepID=UPI000E5C33C7|nr:cellulose biosynthesis cyclic di-GMP-binding regulatory protein BcsB [Caldimonas tepidiphila]